MEHITKANLAKDDKILLYINCFGSYTFELEDFLEIDLSVNKVKNNLPILPEDIISIKEKINSATKGKIVLSKQALNKLPDTGDDAIFKTEPIPFENIVERLYDMAEIVIIHSNQTKKGIYIPNEPVLEEAGCFNMIGYTACPSYEYDSEGNLVVFVGKWSKADCLIKNDYTALISNFAEVLSPNLSVPLKLEVVAISREKDLVSVEGIVKNPECKDKHIELTFEGVEDFKFFYDLEFRKPKKTIEINIYKCDDRYIYVAVSECISFFCRIINDIYLAKCFSNNPKEDLDEEDFEKLKGEIGDKIKKENEKTLLMLHCKTEADELKQIIDGHNHIKDALTLEMVENAFSLVLNKKISIDYFRSWLKLCEETILWANNIQNNIKVRKIVKNLYFDIYYQTDLKVCKPYIVQTLKQIKKQWK